MKGSTLQEHKLPQEEVATVLMGPQERQDQHPMKVNMRHRKVNWDIMDLQVIDIGNPIIRSNSNSRSMLSRFIIEITIVIPIFMDLLL